MGHSPDDQWSIIDRGMAILKVHERHLHQDSTNNRCAFRNCFVLSVKQNTSIRQHTQWLFRMRRRSVVEVTVTGLARETRRRNFERAEDNATSNLTASRTTWMDCAADFRPMSWFTRFCMYAVFILNKTDYLGTATPGQIRFFKKVYTGNHIIIRVYISKLSHCSFWSRIRRILYPTASYSYITLPSLT